MINRIASFQQPAFIAPHSYRCRTRRASLHCALQGLRDAWRTQPNLRVQLYAAAVVIGVGVWVRLALVEWLWVSFAIGLVVFAELMNTAIERTVNLVVGLRPDPLARAVKDAAAGCVLVAAVMATVIGVLTFLSHVSHGS